ncbi:MAG: TadE/TadG family type IV pilus assembly protein [Micrococcales bacterium]
MQRFSDEAGSAVVEFVLVLIPFLLLGGAQLGWLSDVVERSELRVLATDIARYAALADVTETEATASLEQKLKAFSGASGSVAKVNKVAVRVYFASHQWWLAGRSIEVAGIATAELGVGQ